ncbi:transcriptional regulator [Haladaptatus sp. NG-SE-30]
MESEKPERNGKSYSFSLDEFREAIRAEGGMCGTRDVADRVGCSYELAFKRLHELQENGKITSKKVGGSRVWMVNDQ